MSYIFRSDKVVPGERVVLRRLIDGLKSDIIGHVESVSEDGIAIRPQEVGGFPSSLESVFVPQDEIKIVKKLSPRRVLNSEIRNLETAYSKAFPGIEHTWCGQWLLRAGDGITERSNSAAPLGRSALFSPPPIDDIKAFYARHGLPAKILIPERIGKPAEQLALAQGWELGPEIIVMTKSLEPSTPQLPEGLEFSIEDQPDDEWLAMYHFRGEPLPQHALNLLREKIDGEMGFGKIVHPSAGTIAITRATITEVGDVKYLGYSAVEVAPEFRRRGLGTALGEFIMSDGQKKGADIAYLQVIATNAAGIGLYRKLGFVEHHRHRYATITT